MFIEVVKSKIHKATVTEANLQYVGSITIDVALMEAANIIENEKVQIVNVNNGERLETYVIKGERNSGVVCLNGPWSSLFPMHRWTSKKLKNIRQPWYFRTPIPID